MQLVPQLAVELLCAKANVEPASFQVQTMTDVGYVLLLDASQWQVDSSVVVRATLVYKLGVQASLRALLANGACRVWFLDTRCDSLQQDQQLFHEIASHIAQSSLEALFDQEKMQAVLRGLVTVSGETLSWQDWMQLLSEAAHVWQPGQRQVDTESILVKVILNHVTLTSKCNRSIGLVTISDDTSPMHRLSTLVHS